MEIVFHPVKTFTCKYDPKEDRLLLTLNYLHIENRIDFWITRSFLMKLIPIFFDYDSLEDISHTSLSTLDPKAQSPFITDTTMYLLTKTVPILLESVDFQNIDRGARVVLKNIEKSLFYEAILDKHNMHDFIQLILKSVPKYEWGIYNI